MSSEGAAGLPIGMVTDGHPASEDGLTAGQMLRAAREAQGMHVAALAVSLKVPVKKLELLEADAYDELPDAVFTRALAASVCRALKIDAKPIMGKLPQTNHPRLDHEERQVGTPFRASGDAVKPGVLEQINRPAAFAVLALLLAAVVLIFLPDLTNQGTSPGGESSPSSISSNGTGAVSMGAGTGLPPGSTETAVLSPGVPSAASSDTATLAISSSTVAVSTPTVPSPTLVLTPALQGPTAAAATAGPVTDVPAGSLVVFKASGETWVEVTDARGRNALRRLLQAGDTIGAAGAAPLSVTVGRADMTQVTVRGQAFDLASVSSKDLVARFKVN
jgi:cytoskeleton protein RodZ